MSVPRLQLNNGHEIPQVGLGLWQVKNEQECIRAIESALKAGYRHFDTAQIYGNEEFLGKALLQSKILRKDLFITTKIWNDNFFWDDLIPSFEESLNKLRLNYVDLLLLHFPVTETRRPAWRKMEEIYKSGKAKSIGVSNYTVTHLQELLSESDLKPAVNQVELHVYLQQPELVEFCQKNNILLEAYSPLAHGYGMDNEKLVSVAKRHDKSPAQIMLRWCIEKGFVILPKSTHTDRIEDNIRIFDFTLEPDELRQLDGLEANLRTCWDPTHIQ
jgi:diketogulonate reductase-like aldo/keto reductase